MESIENCAAKLKNAIPDARIGIAHGKMSEDDLSAVWRQLMEHEIDILVCTTIIETGVDVPNCNTLIIENADYMGLSQLYQLRGRVGRSSRRAFAYFTFHRGKVLSEVATKRLAAIRIYQIWLRFPHCSEGFGNPRRRKHPRCQTARTYGSGRI